MPQAIQPAAFFYCSRRLDGMQVPVVLKVEDGVFKLFQLALFAHDENIDVFRIGVLGHDFAVVQLAQCDSRLGHRGSPGSGKVFASSTLGKNHNDPPRLPQDAFGWLHTTPKAPFRLLSIAMRMVIRSVASFSKVFHKTSSFRSSVLSLANFSG